MRIISMIILFLLTSECISQPIQNIDRSLNDLKKFVLPCKHENRLGTCTVVEYNNEPVIITAMHVVGPNTTDGQVISLTLGHRYKPPTLTFKVKTPVTKNTDLVLLFPIEDLGSTLPESTISIDNKDVSLRFSDDYLLLGFPASISNDSYFLLTEWDYPFPSQKKMFLSNMIKNDSGPILQVYDGTSSPGLSGGPIIRYNVTESKWELISILLGSFIDNSDVMTDRVSLRVGFSSGFSYGISPYYLFNQ